MHKSLVSACLIVIQYSKNWTVAISLSLNNSRELLYRVAKWHFKMPNKPNLAQQLGFGRENLCLPVCHSWYSHINIKILNLACTNTQNLALICLWRYFTTINYQLNIQRWKWPFAHLNGANKQPMFIHNVNEIFNLSYLTIMLHQPEMKKS